MDEAEAGHRNLVEFTRQDTRWQRSHELVERDGVPLFAGASDYPVFNNGVYRTDDGVPGADVVARAREFFGARGHGFSLWARMLPVDDDLVAAAATALMGKVFDYPQLICRAPVAGGVPADLRSVRDDAGMADYAAVIAAAYTTYGAPDEVSASHFGRADRFTEPHVQSVVAYVGGTPAAAAQILLGHGMAGLYWVGAIEAARGRGLAHACTAAVTNRGFDLGAANVQLQASVMGDPLYRRMGSDELYRYALFATGPPA